MAAVDRSPRVGHQEATMDQPRQAPVPRGAARTPTPEGRGQLFLVGIVAIALAVLVVALMSLIG
jgi:hypothetical protein